MSPGRGPERFPSAHATTLRPVIRRVYLDVLKRRLSEMELRWLLRAAPRYPLVLLSSRLGRPLCGPVLGTLVTNYTCNCRCAMCDLPSQDAELRAFGHPDVGTEGLRAILDGFRAIGVLGVGFTGGEPLLHPAILELLAHCRRRGMVAHLNTNGLLLDDAVARSLCGLGLDSLNVSLDGSRAETHDRIRGVPGAFDGAVEAIRRTLVARGGERKPRVKAVMVVQKDNVDEMVPLAQLAASLGADCVEYIPEQPFRQGPAGGRAGPPADLETASRAREALDALFRAPPLPVENSPRMARLVPWTLAGRASPLRCTAGYNTITVDCYGRAFPCLPWLNWGREPDLLLASGVPGLWRSEEYGRQRARAAACRECTLNCQTELNLMFQPFRSIPRL